MYGKRVFGYQLSPAVIMPGENVRCGICHKQHLKKGWHTNIESIELATANQVRGIRILIFVFGWASLFLSMFGVLRPEASTCVCSKKCAERHLAEVEKDHWTNNPIVI